MKKYLLEASAVVALCACSAQVDAPVDATVNNTSNITVNNYGDINASANANTDINANTNANVNVNGNFQVDDDGVIIVPTLDDLDRCSSKLEGTAVYIKDVKKSAICRNGAWKEVGSENTNSPSYDEVPGGSTSGSVATDPSTSDPSIVHPSITEPVETTPSYPVVDDTPVIETPSNSGSTATSDVVTRPLTGELTCFKAMFCGKAGDTRVETGARGDSYGWWYSYADEDGSYIDWPHGIDEYGSFVWPSVLPSASIHGKAVFGSAENSFVAMAFDLVDGDDTPTDISSWGGMCVVYNSNRAISLSVKPSNEKALTGYNNPAVVLPSSSNKNVIVDVSWSQFKQSEGWGIEGVSTASVLKIASKIALTVNGHAGGSANFLIYSIGKKGTCE